MYTVYADNVCIYNDVSPLEELRLVSPKLELADNSAGSFSFSMRPSNRGYDLIQKMITTITVYKNGVEKWSGRPLSVEEDFWKNRKVFCEGELAFLNDTSQPPAEYHNMTVRGMLAKFIEIHNSKVSDDKKFTVGTVTVEDPNDSLYRYTNFENTLECISDKLVNRLDGHIRIRKSNGVRYIDYLADSDHTTSQTIEFGKNLLDYNKTFKMEDYATVIVPLGERLDESPIEVLDAYLTVESVNDGSIYVKNEEGIAQFGWIEKIVHWDDVTTPARLLTKARNYLSDLQFEDVSLEVKAVDLNIMDISAEDIDILDKVRAVSKPHGMDRYFLVSKMSIPLDKPDDMTFTLGTTYTASLTAANNQASTEVNKKIENSIVTASGISKNQISYYNNDIQRLTALMAQSFGSFKTEEKQADGSSIYYIHDKKELEESTKIWKYTADGFVVSDDGGKTWKAGLDASGNAVMNVLSAVGVQADWVKAGTIEGEIIAKNLMMQGGSIDISTATESADCVKLSYNPPSTSRKLTSEMRPTGFIVDTRYDDSDEESIRYGAGSGLFLTYKKTDKTGRQLIIDKDRIDLYDIIFNDSGVIIGATRGSHIDFYTLKKETVTPKYLNTQPSVIYYNYICKNGTLTYSFQISVEYATNIPAGTDLFQIPDYGTKNSEVLIHDAKTGNQMYITRNGIVRSYSDCTGYVITDTIPILD